VVHEIATALLPVFFVLALGYGAGRRKFIDSRNVSTLNQLVMVFAIPASLFVSISTKQRSAITSPGTYIAGIVIATLLVAAVILWRQLKVFRLDKGSAAVQALTVSATLSASAPHWASRHARHRHVLHWPVWRGRHHATGRRCHYQ
jgi:malonate transporter